MGAKVLTESFDRNVLTEFFFWNHILNLGLGGSWAGLGWAGLGWAGKTLGLGLGLGLGRLGLGLGAGDGGAETEIGLLENVKGCVPTEETSFWIGPTATSYFYLFLS